MKLTNEGIKQKDAWLNADYQLPSYDREAMVERTQANPEWIHFGAGNLFKAFQANVVETLLNEGIMDKGIIAVEGFDTKILQNSREHDTLALLATLKSDGTADKVVIGSIAEADLLSCEHEEEFNRLKEIFRNPSLQMASFTITEKGYSLTNANNELLPAVQEDFNNGPAAPKSYMGKVVALLLSLIHI